MASLLLTGTLTFLLGLITFSLLLLRALRPSPPPHTPPKHGAHLVILLGSGGHTAEMLSLLRGIPGLVKKFPKRTYIFSTGDWLSAKKAETFEESLVFEKGAEKGKGYELREVPRSRLVGQGWGSVPFSAGRCFMKMIAILFSSDGDVVLMNGPGNAVVAAVGAVVLGVLRPWKRRMRLVYVESFARIEGLSLSGKLVYPFVDRFLVQWEGLKAKYPRAEYRGVLV